MRRRHKFNSEQQRRLAAARHAVDDGARAVDAGLRVERAHGPREVLERDLLEVAGQAGRREVGERERRVPGAGEPARRADEMGRNLEAYLMSRVRGDVKSSSVTASESGGLMVVTLRAACEENIAELREYTPVQDAP